MEHKLNDNLYLKCIGNVKIDAVDYYKYGINNLKIGTDNSKNIYLNKKINLDEIDKEKLSNYITEKTTSSDDIFINLNDFMLNENTESSGGAESTDSTAGRNKANNPSSTGFVFLSQEKFDEAHKLINNVDECGNIMMALINLNGHNELNGQNTGIADSITGFKSKINGLAGGNGPTAFFYEYKSTYNDLLEGINIAVASQYLLLEEKGYLKQSEESLAMFGNDAFSKEFRELMNSVINGERTFNSTTELNNAIAELQSKYSVVTEDDARMILGAASLTLDSEELKDMSSKEREEFIKNKNEQLDSIYDHLNKTIGITRDAFDNMLKNNLDELAKMISDASIKSAENVKAGGEGKNIMNDLIYSMQDSWYSTSAGQDALHNRFKNESITKFDEYDALANTEYIQYCIMTGHVQDWLKEDYKMFANIVARIDANGSFTIDTDEITDEELTYIDSYVSMTGYLPYGYEKVGDTYKKKVYTNQGQAMLYYMDYHCGENVGNSGEDRIITAFSNQGVLDAYQRNYKGAWIDSRLTGNYTSEAQKQAAIAEAERDYNILNGIEDDPIRKQELIEEGNIPFEQLSNFVNSDSVDLSKLADRKYIEENKEAIMKETGLTEAQLFNFAITGSMPTTGDAYLDTQAQVGAVLFSSIGVAGLQALSGVQKYFENVGDAIKTAVNSDFILNLRFITDSNGNVMYNLSETIELTKEFKEFQTKVWNNYYGTDLYNEQYDNFVSSGDGKKAVKAYYDKYLYDPLTGQYKGRDGKIYYSYDDIPLSEKQSMLPQFFKQSKLNEWCLNDSSSSNYYLAAFQEGIRNGGDFSLFDTLDRSVVENATAQFKTINEVSIDKTGTWWNENVYSKDWYNTAESFSIVKKDNILGMTANQLGNMAIPVLLSAVGNLKAIKLPQLGQMASSGALFTSAFGGATEEAFINGASYNEALQYATLSASTELLIEKVFSGVAGYGEGWFDDVLDYVPNKLINTLNLTDNLATQIAKKMITNGIGEGVEEIVTDFVTPLWQSITYLSEKNYSDLLKENVSLESEVQTFLVSFLSSMVFGTGNISSQIKKFNNQMSNLESQIGEIPGIKDTANKVLAEIIGYDKQLLTSDIITEIINKNSAELLKSNPNAKDAINTLTEKLKEAQQALNQQNVVIKTSNGDVNVSKATVMDIADMAGIDNKYTITDGVVEFESDSAKNSFIETTYNVAKNHLNDAQAQNLNNSLMYILQFNGKNVDVNVFEQAIKLVSEDVNITSPDKVNVSIDGKEVYIYKDLLNELIQDKNITEMSSEDIIKAIYEKTLEKIDTYGTEVNNKLKDVNVGLELKNDSKMDTALKSLDGVISNKGPNIVVKSATNIEGKEQIKYEVETNIDGDNKTIAVYIDTETKNTIYKNNNKLLEKIEEVINDNKGENEVYIKNESQSEVIKENTFEETKAITDKSKSAIYEAPIGMMAVGTVGAVYNEQTQNTKISNNKVASRNKSSSRIQNQAIAKENILNNEDISYVNAFANAKTEINSFMKNIENTLKQFVETNSKAIDLKTRFENLKQQMTMRINDKLYELRKNISDAYDNKIRELNNQIDTLTEGGKLRERLINSRDELIIKRDNEISMIEDIARNKFNEIISSFNIESTNVSTTDIDLGNYSINNHLNNGLTSENIDLSKIQSSDELIDILFKTNSKELSIDRNKKGISLWLEEKKNGLDASIYKSYDGTAHNSRKIISETFDDGDSAKIISGKFVGKNRGKWYRSGLKEDYRITFKNSSQIDADDTIEFINTFIEEANKQGLDLLAKNYWAAERDAFILYVPKKDLLKTIKLLEDLKDASKYSDAVSRATKSFGTPSHFAAVISNNPYYGISMSHGDVLNRNGTSYSTAGGTTTFNQHLENILNNAYQKLFEKYNGDVTKINVDELYEIMYDAHQQYMLGENSNSDIPFWMNDKNYNEYIESLSSVNTYVEEISDTLNSDEIVVEDVSADKVVMPQSFEVDSVNIFSGKETKVPMDTKLLEELTQDSSKLARRLFGLSQKIPKDAIKDGVIKYIDFAKENNIPIQIDENVQKWYDAVKNAKENNLILTNENDIIRNGATPETKSIFDDYIKYNRYGVDIKVSELLDIIDGKTNISLTLTQFTTALNNLSNYINQNSIKLNENITNILNKITNIEQNQVVINPIEVINGESPIILNKNINVDGRNVSTLQLIELISNKNNLLGLISNTVYIEGLQYVNIEQAVIELFNISPELSIQYNDILDLIKDAKNSYVLFDIRTNAYAILPKEINGVKTETIFELTSSSTKTINRIINSEDVETVNKYISTIESIVNIINEKNVQIDVSDLVDLKNKLEVPETKSRNVFGILHKAYSWNQEIGGTYGPEQSAVGIKLSKIPLKSSIETLFKTKMTDIEFFNHLGLDSVTQEKFKKILEKNYRKQNGIFAKMFGDYVNNETTYQEIQKLADIVKNNIPNLDDKQAFMFLYYMEAGEIGKNGICSYADAASIIINEYLGKPIEFEQDFGFPMYTVNSDGNRIYNYEMLIVDMYSSINKESLLTVDNKTGSVIFNSTNQNQTYLADFNIGINEEVLNKYFKDKNIKLSLNKTFDFNSERDIMHYEKVLEAISQKLQKGNTVHLSAKGFALVNEQGHNVADDIGGHAMTVLGIDSDGNLVVNSWGKVAIFDLKAELAKTGNKYFDTDANGNVTEQGTSSIYIQAVDTTKESVSEFDGVIELSKHSNRGRVQSNIGANDIKLGNKETKGIKKSIEDNVKQTINEQEVITIESIDIVDENGIVNFDKLKLEIDKLTEYIRNVSKNFFNQKYSDNSITNGVSYYNKFRSEQHKYYDKEISKVFKTVLEKGSEIGNEIYKLNLELQELENNDTDSERINELLSNYRKSKIYDVKKIIKNKIKNLETNKGQLLLQVEKVYEIANSEFTNAILKPIYDKYYGVYEKIASRYDTPNDLFMNSARYKLQLRNLHRNLVSQYGQVDAAYFIEEIGNKYIREHSIKLTGNNFELSNILERLDKNIISQEKIDVLSTIIQELNLKLKENNIIIRIQENLIGSNSIDNLILNLQSINNSLDTVKNVNEMLVNKSNAVIPNEIVIANTISPSNFVSQYYSNSTREVNLNAKTYNMKIIHIYDSIVTEEKIVHQYAHLLAKNIIANNPSFVKEWIIAMSNDTKYVSNYAQVSIIEDIVETITKSIMYPIGPRECDLKYSYRFALIRGTNKLPNSGIFENANKKYNLYIQAKRGTFVYEDVYEDVSISDKQKYILRNNIEILQFDDKVIEDYDYKGYVKHLILDGEIFEDGIYGAHSMKYFNELVRNSKDSEGNARIKIIEKIKHPTIDGLYSIKYSVDGVEITNPKTIYDPSKISDNLILEFANEAIDNRILIDDGQDRNYIGISSNGMIYQMHYDNNVLQSIYPVFEPSDVPTSLIVPIKVRKETYYIPVNIDAQRNRDTFRYGKSLINRTQQEFMKLSNEEKQNIILGTVSIDLGEIKYNPKTGEIDTIGPLNETYSSIPTTTLLDFVKLDVDGIAKVIINKQEYNGYDADTMLDAIIEVYNYSKENNINISINPNLEHFIKEYQKVNLDVNNILMNIEDALYKKENIISLPTRIQVSSYSRVSVIDLFNIINGRKNISETYYSEVDIYEATKEIAKYFEDKNVTMSALTKNAFDIVKIIDENSVVINFIDAINGKEKIVLPKTIEDKFGDSKIQDVISYLNGETSFISPGVIESLKEYINTNNVYIPSEMMDKINLLSTLGEDNILLNEKAYLKGESSPIIVPKNLEGIYTKTSNIYAWITGEEKFYSTTEEVIKLTTKFTEYIYSNNIILDNTTMSKLEVLKNLKEDETIINLEDFFNGSSAIIVKNNISLNGTNIKLSTVLDTINLTDNTHLKILSGKNIDGVTRENIFNAIDELYKVRPELRLTTISNYSKIKNIYDNNYIFYENYLFPKEISNIKCELIEEILNSPIKIAKYNSDERIQIIDAINEYIELIGDEVGKYFAYNERVKMRDSLLNLISREIPQIDLLKEVYSPLYYLFSNSSENGGTFGTNQGIIREMLKELGIKDAIKALFPNENISDENFLSDLNELGDTKEKLIQALNDLFWNPKRESVARLINFIKNNKEIRLVQKNFPGMNGVDAIRFLYLAETVEAGNNGICNYAAATNMIFNKYLGKEASFKADFGYPMYIINSQGKKVLNDSMLLVDMYSIINKGVLVKEINGKYEIATTNDNYLNLADVGRFEMDYLQRFIDAKGIDLGLKENFYYSSYEGHILWKEELIIKIKESLEKGEYINVSGAGFDLLRKDGSIACKDCDGHIMTLVGLTTDGKVIVDSWGQELLIDLESTLEHIGEKYGRDGYTRRLAIASYELTNGKTNVNIKSNHLSDPYLETFDIPREIDMIDESTKPNQNPQIQIDNVKQLSIMENIKHTLQRINDKFTGYKTSKLNTESYYERTTKSNNKLFKQKQINKTFRDFANKHLIDLETLINNGLLRNPKISEINSLITNNRVLSNMVDGNVSIADILGTKKNIDLDKNFGLLFNEGSSEFRTRDLGLLEYTNDQILNVLSESFKSHPIIISEVDTGKYIIEDNGYHRYSILRLHYLNEYIKVKNNPELVRELNEKYTIPVKVYKLDTTKTYCTSILKELGINIEVKTKGFKKTSSIFIDGKKVIMSDTELVEFTKNMINSTSNSTQIINKLLSMSESFNEFYNEYFVSESEDYGIELDENFVTEGMQIKVNNKTYSLDTIIDILENRYLDILKGKTIEGINSQNMFGIINKVFENNPLIETQYKSNYDNIIDIFKTKYVHENGNLYPKTFNFIKTQDIVEILKNPYKIQKYNKEKQIQINEAIKMYVRYSFSNNYYLGTKEYKVYKKIFDLISRDVPNIKLTTEVKSSLLTEFRRNEINGGTFGSKQGIIRSLLERNGITNAINCLFNINATGTNFLEQIKEFTNEEFIELLDDVVDESGRLKGLYWLTEQFDLLELMSKNLDGMDDFEIIKFLYLFETLEAGAKGICNYSVAVNMIFNKYLGKESQFEKDFGYPMYVVTKNGKKVLNDMMLLVDMYSTINKEVFTKKIDDIVKVIVTSNEDYLKVANIGGSFNMDNLKKFFDKKSKQANRKIKLDLNQTFAFDSQTDVMWKEEILTKVKQSLEKGETVNLSAAGFNLYRKDGTLAYEDFGAHAMTIVGLTKDGNLIVDSHGREMIVNLDLTLENLSKDYVKNGKPMTRRIGITTYSFDSSVSSSNQNMDIIDVSDSIVSQEFDEGIFDVFSKPTGDIELFKDALINNKVDTLTEHEIISLVEIINKGKIKPKDYNLTSETIRILIDKVPLKKIFPISNVTAIKSFIDYFGVETLVEFDRLNNDFLFGNNGENIYSLFDFYDLSIPKTNETDKLKEFNKLIKDTINSNKKTEYKTYTFNYSGLIGTEFAKLHPELFLDESAPQDLKDAFYNGLVNSSNEYKPEWSPYLEGKSVKGVIHKSLISYKDVKIVEKINTIGENSTKYYESLQELALKVGMTTTEVENILISKMKLLIENSEFGVRRTLKSLDSILESGKLKNQFEVNHSSYGVSNTDMRMDMEKDLFGIPRNIKYEDRPIYGMLLPEDLSSKYVHKGPGAYYSDGNGVIYIFDKSKIMNNATLTLGDSIDQAGKICATNLSNPRYFGMFSEMLSTIKTKEDLLNFEFTSLYEKTVMEVGNSAYYEFQLHGSDSHTLDNLKEIVFLKMPEAKIIKKLEEKNIKWRVIDQDSSKKNNSPSIKKDKVIKDNSIREGYFSFDRTKQKPIKELSSYYGDAGKRVNSLFLEGKTTDEVMEELTIFERNKFKKFLEETIQGKYLSRLTDDEITALSLYTKDHFTEINFVLRHNNMLESIAGRKPEMLIENIDSAIFKYGGLEQPMIIYRAVDVRAFTHQNSTYKELFKGIKVYNMKEVYAALKTLEGKEFSDLGYMSSSPAYGTSFAKHLRYSIVLEIAAPKGTKCAYINQLSSFYNAENEILLARNTKLQIVEVLEPDEDIFNFTKVVVRCIVKE